MDVEAVLNITLTMKHNSCPLCMYFFKTYVSQKRLVWICDSDNQVPLYHTERVIIESTELILKLAMSINQWETKDVEINDHWLTVCVCVSVHERVWLLSCSTRIITNNSLYVTCNSILIITFISVDIWEIYVIQDSLVYTRRNSVL